MGQRPNQGQSPKQVDAVTAGQSPRRTSGGEAAAEDQQLVGEIAVTTLLEMN